MSEHVTITDDLSITSPSWWSRGSTKGPRQKGIRITEGRGFIFLADDEILPLANALADHLANNNTEA